MASGGDMLAGFVQGFGGSIVGDMEKHQKFELEARGLLLRDALMRRLEGERREYQTSERKASQEYRTGERMSEQEYRTGENMRQEAFRSEESEKDRNLTREGQAIQRGNLSLRQQEFTQAKERAAEEAKERAARLEGLNADVKIKNIQANQAEEIGALKNKFKDAMERAAKGDEGARKEATVYQELLNGLSGKIKQNPSITVTPIKQPNALGDGEVTTGYIIGNDGGAGKYSVYTAGELIGKTGQGAGAQAAGAPAAGVSAPKAGQSKWDESRYYRPSIPSPHGGTRG